jgi:uncharacterized protein (DUF1778 family)
MSTVVTKDTRLVACVSQEVQELINNAVEISGATISQFLVDAATAKALDVISQAQTVKLSMAGAAKVFDAIESPPEPNKKLMVAAKRYQEEKP